MYQSPVFTHTSEGVPLCQSRTETFHTTSVDVNRRSDTGHVTWARVGPRVPHVDHDDRPLYRDP